MSSKIKSNEYTIRAKTNIPNISLHENSTLVRHYLITELFELVMIYIYVIKVTLQTKLLLITHFILFVKCYRQPILTILNQFSNEWC